MSVKMEETKTNTVKLTISVEPDEFEQSMQKAFLKVRKSVSIPGFRKGKAPRRMIENFYGGESVFFEEAFNLAFPDAYEKAVEETGIEPVDHPNLDIDAIGDGKGLVFTAEVTVKPAVKLGQFKGIEVEKPEYNVTAEDVESEVQKARENVARWVEAEGKTVENGDRVTLDYAGTVDGVAFDGGTAQDQMLEIGSGRFIPGFEEQMIGMAVGEERDLQVKFPDEYHSEELKGKDAVFKVKVKAITVKELPELDDEFAKDVSEFDTMEQYRGNIRQTLEKQAEERTRNELYDALIEKAVAVSELEVPDCMVESQIDAMLRDMEFRMSMQGIRMDDYLRITGMDRDTLRGQYKQTALDRVKSQLVLEAIQKAEDITADEESVDEEIRKVAEARKKEFDEVKSKMTERELEHIKADVIIQKTLKLLEDNAVFTQPKKEADEAGNPECSE